MSVIHYKIYCEAEAVWKDVFLEESSPVPTTCPEDTGHAVTADSAVIVDKIGPADVLVQNQPNVHIRKPDGATHDRVYGFSPNFCDKTTWYQEALEVVDEAVGTGNGLKTVFNLGRGTNNHADERIIDLGNGKVSEENNIPNPRGEYRGFGLGYVSPSAPDPFALAGDLSGYIPIIKVNGAEKTARMYGESSGGDYIIDYVAGKVTFFVPPPTGHVVTATYWYAAETTTASVLVAPQPGKKHMIDRVEIQSTSDACPVTDILMNVYVYGPFPGGFPAARPTVIKNVNDIVNWSYGAQEQILPQGGVNLRATSLPINIHQVRYASEIPLLSSLGMYMRVHLPQAKEFAGTWANIVMYGITEDE